MLARGCACSWIEVVIACGCACSWIGVGFGILAWWVSTYRRGGFWRTGVLGFSFGLPDFWVVMGLFCDGCGFVLFYCKRYIILL